MTASTQAEQLRRTTAALNGAKVAYAAICDRAADHQANAYKASQRLATAKADNARRRVAMALGDVLPGSGDGAADLVDNAAENEAIAAEFKVRTDRALAAMNVAQAAHNDAARAFLIREAVTPAATRMAAAMNSLADAAAGLMGAHYAAYERFPKEGRYLGSRGELYGPAAELIRHLNREFAWTEAPYSIRPDWLPKHGPLLDVGKLSGVAEAERAALDLVEGAAS